MFSSRTRRLALGAAAIGTVAAALSTATVTTAAAAPPPGTYVALIPYVAPKVDVAQGIGFPTIARDSSGISYAETWQIDAGTSGHVIFRNRLQRPDPNGGFYSVCLDIQDTANNGPANPGAGKPVGVSRCDGSSSQQWKVDDDTFGGQYYSSKLVNRLSGLRLTWNGSGANPAYSQKSVGALGDARIVVKVLG